MMYPLKLRLAPVRTAEFVVGHLDMTSLNNAEQTILPDAQDEMSFLGGDSDGAEHLLEMFYDAA